MLKGGCRKGVAGSFGSLRRSPREAKRKWPGEGDVQGETGLRMPPTTGEAGMAAYETSAKVQAEGEVRVAGVPFAPGTEVEVTISPKPRSGDTSTHVDDEALAAARARMRELFGAIKGFRMGPKIPREELHERGSLH